MDDMSARDLATALIRANASLIRHSYLMDDHMDAFNNGMATVCEHAVIMAFGWSREEAKRYIRAVCQEVGHV